MTFTGFVYVYIPTTTSNDTFHKQSYPTVSLQFEIFSNVAVKFRSPTFARRTLANLLLLIFLEEGDYHSAAQSLDLNQVFGREFLAVLGE